MYEKNKVIEKFLRWGIAKHQGYCFFIKDGSTLATLQDGSTLGTLQDGSTLATLQDGSTLATLQKWFNY